MTAANVVFVVMPMLLSKDPYGIIGIQEERKCKNLIY
jgi:hypothetical protein